MDIALQMVGLVGVGLIVFAFFMQQCGRWTVDHLVYHLANAAGAIGILLSLIAEWNLSQFVIEAFWLAISLIGLVHYFRVKRKKL